jgi:hypothetical protein
MRIFFFERIHSHILGLGLRYLYYFITNIQNFVLSLSEKKSCQHYEFQLSKLHNPKKIKKIAQNLIWTTTTSIHRNMQIGHRSV